jgi:hypothetical protein
MQGRDEKTLSLPCHEGRPWRDTVGVEVTLPRLLRGQPETLLQQLWKIEEYVERVQ